MQSLVDCTSTLTHISFTESLGSSKVDKVQLGDGIVGRGEGSRPRLDVYGEDAVRTRRVLIE